jgi:hypothetical protein
MFPHTIWKSTILKWRYNHHFLTNLHKIFRKCL